ncbi:MAG: TonB-dependent receptor [Panacagrimonas sp.]
MPSYRLPLLKRVALVSLVCGLAAPPSSGAAEDLPTDTPAEPAGDTVETITVEAHPFGRGADDLVQPVSVLAGDELDAKRRSTIGEALENEPGVASSDFGPGVGRPIVRGQGGARVAVLENGIGSMDVSTISNDHAVGIDPSNAEQIEIIKGPGTLIFGSAASAGVVNVVNDRLPDRVRQGFTGAADLSYGDNAAERLGRLDAGYGAGLYQFHADVSGRETNFFEVPGNAYADGSAPDRHRIPNSAVKTSSGAVSLSRIGEEGSSLGIALSRFETEYGLPQEEDAFIDLEQTRVDAQAKLITPLSGVESLKIRAGANDYEHTEFEAPGEPGTRFENDEIEARIEALHAPLAGFRGVLGMQLIARDFQAIGEEAFVPPVETRSVGLFLVEERDFSRGRFEVGARIEQQEQELQGQDERPDVDHTPLSFSAGAIYDLNADYHLRLNLASAQRAPAAEEVYARGPHLATRTFERGNLDLEEETSNNIELGIDKHEGRWTWSASVYYTQISDYIFLAEADEDGDGIADQVTPEGEPFDPAGPEDQEGPLLRVDYRQDDAEFTGFEAETAWKFLDGPLQLTGRLFADRVRARRDSGGDLPRITPARFGTGLDARAGALRAGLNLTRVDGQDRVASLETETDGYTLLSADLAYTLGVGGGTTTLYLRGRNLLDEEARRHTSFLKDFAPLPGASLIVGVNLRFD